MQYVGMRGRGKIALLVIVATALALTALPAAAQAYTKAAGYSASDYATGFESDAHSHIGPIGVAFDRSDNLYVSDAANGNLYRFQPGGGSADINTQLTAFPISGSITGLAFTRSGHLFLARQGDGDVVEIDPGTGRVLRTAASGLRCATGLATDPASDDLFVSSTCDNRIKRIANPAGSAPQVSTFASVPCCSDGLAFGSDGTMYATSEGSVLRIAGTSSSTPGVAQLITKMTEGDGIAVSRPRSGTTPFLIVNRVDGVMERIDLTDPPTRTRIISGGTRGDFVAVDSRGCLFATQTSTVLRVSPPDGCDLAPSTPGAGTGPAQHPGIVIDTLGRPTRFKCVAAHRLVVRVRQHGRVRLRSVKVYVNGHLRRTLRHRRVTSAILIKRVPRGTFTVKLVARTTKGRRLVARKRYKNCLKARSHH